MNFFNRLKSSQIARSLGLVCIFALSAANVSAQRPKAADAGLRLLSMSEARAVLPSSKDFFSHRDEILLGVEFSLHYLSGDAARADFERLKGLGVSPELLVVSLKRFRQVLMEAQSPEELRDTLDREFDVYRSVGMDGRGTVKLTGYFQPVYKASRTKSDKFQFPIYRRPITFESWSEPHPTRIQLEGVDGKGGGMLEGSELAWLPSRYEAFMIHLQGSSILELPDGERMAVGFDGATNHRFVGISKEWLRTHRVSWTQLKEYYAVHPEELDQYLARNNRFIFFKENPHPLPIGSLGVPVIAGHSIATDKAQFVPGGLGLVRGVLPRSNADGSVDMIHETRFVLDQDTGSAIKGPGRADVFMGTGDMAQAQANKLFAPGELYYLLLKKAQK